jgi:CDP-diacylglycerol--glycerol-3-phosphate 3-phosphatidyltransferase
MTARGPTPADRPPVEGVSGSGALLSVPNVLCAVRIVFCPVLVVLARFDLASWCLALMLLLLLTDWLDGKLAKLWRQETTFGARLDSLADAVFYGCALAALVLLRGEVLRGEAVWIAAAGCCYLVSVAAGWLKFRRVPSYHTRLAKTCSLLMAVAITSILIDLSVWPFRVAMAAVAVANLEATAITLVLRGSRVNVPSVFHALRVRGRASDEREY